MNQSCHEVLNSIPGGIAEYRIGKTLETLMFSDGIPKMQGFTREEYEKAVEKDALDVVYEADRPILKEMVKQSCLNGEELHVSYRVYCKNGEVIWVNLSAYPKEGHDNGEIIYRAIFSNITSQFNLYRDICDYSTTGVLVFDKSNGEVYYANKTIFDFAGHEFRPYEKLKAGDILGRDVTNQEIELMLAGEVTFTHEVKGNGKVLQIHTREIPWLHRKMIILYASDVTDEYRRQEQLQRRYEDQVNYSRMLSSTSVASSMVNLTKQWLV